MARKPKSSDVLCAVCGKPIAPAALLAEIAAAAANRAAMTSDTSAVA